MSEVLLHRLRRNRSRPGAAIVGEGLPDQAARHKCHGVMIPAGVSTMPISAYVQSVAFLVLGAAALFGGAGTLAIPAFRIYLGILAAIMIASLAWLDPDLARERMRPGGQKPPIALRLFAFVLVAHWLIAGLDRGRFHWSDDVPLWLRVLGFVALAAGYVLCFWAMRVNRFFSSIIRIQSDRGQRVIDSGPYAVVRHPGYISGILVMLGSGLALCSWVAWAFLVVFSVPFLMYRVITEDRVLQAELPGYRDYAARVRWRLVPGVW
jgi:protein-S-isoprenylcysteine O-methyltransferase Ste14